MNDFLNNVLGYSLDDEQKACVLDQSNYLLIVAGAGSGKTLTMIGKVLFLINNNIKEQEILCISFTNETTNNFKTKLKKCYIYQVEVLTFHKLAINILKKCDHNIQLAKPDTLEYIIDEFLEHIILDSKHYMIIVLKYFNINNFFKIKKKYLCLINTNKFRGLKKLIAKFIHLIKSHNLNINNIVLLYKKEQYYLWNTNRYFFKLVIIIYLLYSHELKSNNMYDFDDLLIEASKVIEKHKLKLPYKYILIDEFQDTSPIRLELIKTIVKYNSAKLTVVGDDWQSIYRFTGCNLDLFINFNKFFKGAKIMKIQNTYRNSKQLIDIAGDFIMQNKKQLTKELKSNIKLNNPIKIIYYNSNPKQSFSLFLEQLYQDKKFPILILGRNNKDIFYYLDKHFIINNNYQIIDTKHPDFEIKYLTVHKAKGLESAYVVIINLTNSINGFPNQIKNEQIITKIIPDKKIFPFDEERRLFYVALTRTKNEVFLFTPKNNPSIFIQELINNYQEKIITKDV